MIGTINNTKTISSRAVRADRVVFSALLLYVFSIPFESVHMGVLEQFSSLSKPFGLLFALLAIGLGQARRLDRAVAWSLWAYIAVYIGSTMFQDPSYSTEIIKRLIQFVQLSVSFWLIVSNVKDRSRARTVVLTLMLACTLAAVLHLTGFAANHVHDSRVAAFNDNPNDTGYTMAIGALCAIGISMWRDIPVWARRLSYLSLPITLLSLVTTGSRGATMAFVVGGIAYTLVGGTLPNRIRRLALAMIPLLVLGFLVVRTEQSKNRLQSTFLEGQVGPRQQIFPTAVEMVLEKPITGWGPVTHLQVLGDRLSFGGERDTHNLYLWLLTEVGLLGSVPFFLFLWICMRGGWRSRACIEGSCINAVLLAGLAMNITGTYRNSKLFWLSLALALSLSKLCKRLETHDALGLDSKEKIHQGHSRIFTSRSV